MSNKKYVTCTCIDKSMQIVLEQGSIDKPMILNFKLVCYIQLSFHSSVFTNHLIHMHTKIFSIQKHNYSNISAKCAEGLHFSAFYYNNNNNNNNNYYYYYYYYYSHFIQAHLGMTKKYK